MKPIENKWVYKVKHRAYASTERYESRLVTKGYNQVEGYNFFDTCPQLLIISKRPCKVRKIIY